jgi:hypothetical protein
MPKMRVYDGQKGIEKRRKNGVLEVRRKTDCQESTKGEGKGEKVTPSPSLRACDCGVSIHCIETIGLPATHAPLCHCEERSDVTICVLFVFPLSVIASLLTQVRNGAKSLCQFL